MQNLTPIIDIPYVRVSTSDATQMASLGNQYKKLQTIGTPIVHVGSGGKGLPDDLKEKIINAKKEGICDIRIVVIALDRLSRDIADINFLKQYVRYIHTVDTNMTYDLQKDRKIILSLIDDSAQELELIKKRCSRPKLLGAKRPRNEDEYDQKRAINAKDKCDVVTSNMGLFGLNMHQLEELQNVIQNSQVISNEGQYVAFFNKVEKIGVDMTKYKRFYKSYETIPMTKAQKAKNKRNTNGEVIKNIKKKHLTDIVHNIIRLYGKFVNENHVFVKQFINGNLLYSTLVPDKREYIVRTSNKLIDMLTSSVSEMNKKEHVTNSSNKLISMLKSLNMFGNNTTQQKEGTFFNF